MGAPLRNTIPRRTECMLVYATHVAGSALHRSIPYLSERILCRDWRTNVLVPLSIMNIWGKLKEQSTLFCPPNRDSGCCPRAASCNIASSFHYSKACHVVDSYNNTFVCPCFCFSSRPLYHHKHARFVDICYPLHSCRCSTVSVLGQVLPFGLRDHHQLCNL